MRIVLPALLIILLTRCIPSAMAEENEWKQLDSVLIEVKEGDRGRGKTVHIEFTYERCARRDLLLHG